MARVHLAYKNTNWKPTRYWWSDHPQNQQDMDDVLLHLEQDYPCWYRSDVCEIITGDYVPAGGWAPEPQVLPEHIHSWDYCIHHNAARVENFHWPKEGWHLGYEKFPDKDPIENTKLCKYVSGINAMLQQACLELFNPIYVIGADLGFKPRERGESDQNHFDPSYNNKHYDEYHAWQDNEGHQIMYADARRWANDNGINIINATKGGELKSLPRVKYEDLFDRQ